MLPIWVASGAEVLAIDLAGEEHKVKIEAEFGPDGGLDWNPSSIGTEILMLKLRVPLMGDDDYLTSFKFVACASLLYCMLV